LIGHVGQIERRRVRIKAEVRPAGEQRSSALNSEAMIAQLRRLRPRADAERPGLALYIFIDTLAAQMRYGCPSYNGAAMTGPEIVRTAVDDDLLGTQGSRLFDHFCSNLQFSRRA
jgi:hypothetical protein